MSHKETCPGCGSRTSTIWLVMQGDDGYERCPTCGLSGGTMHEVIAARKRGADADLTERYVQATIRADKAEAEARVLRRRLAAVKDALTEELSEIDGL